MEDDFELFTYNLPSSGSMAVCQHTQINAQFLGVCFKVLSGIVSAQSGRDKQKDLRVSQVVPLKAMTCQHLLMFSTCVGRPEQRREEEPYCVFLAA